jgi:hypothetical protein
LGRIFLADTITGAGDDGPRSSLAVFAKLNKEEEKLAIMLLGGEDWVLTLVPLRTKALRRS